jgi:hypothetical protein
MGPEIKYFIFDRFFKTPNEKRRNEHRAYAERYSQLANNLNKIVPLKSFIFS